MLKRGEAAGLTLSCGAVSVTAEGEIPEEATGTPLDGEAALKSFSKLGGTGFTLWNYITQKRLSRAYYLIRSGVSNKDAAHISGFQDYSTFYKAYTRLRGFSPKDDRPSETYDPLLTNFYPLGDDTILL